MNKMKETKLCKLAFKYGTDKCPQLRKHTYTEYYYNLLKGRQKTIKKVLEIGIGGGASLLMWRDFFSNAKIYGADYSESLLIKRDRIQSILCDQRRKKHLINLIEKTGSDINLIIDDASHQAHDQIFTCLTLMPLLNKRVIYIIEDVADPSIIERLSQYDVEIPKLSYIRRYDNRLVVIRHKKMSKDKQTHISFFAKRPSIAKSNRHILRGSSSIRGNQIAEYLGAKLNPKSGFENDVCIYVKPSVYPGTKLPGYKSYVDILDAFEFVAWLKDNPDVSIIVASLQNHQYLLNNFHLANKIVLIPQHHCNFERIKRHRKKVATVGTIGTPTSFMYGAPTMYSIDDFNEKLNRIGLTFLNYSAYRSREDVVNFYKKIDIQVIYRQKSKILSNPLRIINAASFGIPTVAYHEDAFDNVDKYYISVNSMDDMLAKLEELKNSPILYTDYANKGIYMAEEYHIEKIAEMYKKLTVG